MTDAAASSGESPVKRGFTLRLLDGRTVRDIDGVRSFVGEDDSGSFGILPGHARFTTCLTFGLARFLDAGGTWTYLALPGAVLYFADGALNLCTRRYYLDTDYNRIVELMETRLLEEERAMSELKHSLAQLEQEMLKRLWRLGRDAPVGGG
ncbi:MAG: F0F1 ATP synthase subunit epsilon [Methylococcaceae bacterium]|nr:F0F1 ATP synthase subunit epsilon [Methylococcaceae bacterium]